MIGAIPKTNRQEALKQAGTHILRCRLRPEGGAKTKTFVRTGFHCPRRIMQRIAVLRKASAENAETWRSGTGFKRWGFVHPMSTPHRLKPDPPNHETPSLGRSEQRD